MIEMTIDDDGSQGQDSERHSEGLFDTSEAYQEYSDEAADTQSLMSLQHS